MTATTTQRPALCPGVRRNPYKWRVSRVGRGRWVASVLKTHTFDSDAVSMFEWVGEVFTTHAEAIAWAAAQADDTATDEALREVTC